MKKLNDIKSEIKLIEFFGLCVSESDEYNHYIVTDAKGNNAGTIKHSNIQIDTDELSIESGAKNIDLPNSQSNLEIFFKKAEAYIIAHIGPDSTAIKMHLAENKILMFYFDKDQIQFVCKEPYNYYLEEYVKVDIAKKTYHYSISFLDAKDKKHNYPAYLGEIDCHPLSKEQDNFIKIRNTWPTWRGKQPNNHKPNYISIVEGTIEDVILEHKMGINAFNRMRYLMNTIPGEKDITSFLIQNTPTELPNYLDLFIPEIKKKNKSKRLMKSIIKGD